MIKESQTVLFMMLLLQSFTTQAQDKFIWLKLTDNRVMINARFQEVRGESLMVRRGSGFLTLSLADIKQFRLMNEAPILQWTLLGTGAGVATGALIGAAVRFGETIHWSFGVTTIVFGVIGGIIGGVSASLEDGGGIVDCSGKTSAEKKEIIERLLGEIHNPSQ